MQMSWHEALRARRDVRDLCRRYDLDRIQTTSELIEHAEAIAGVPIRLEQVASFYPSNITGYIHLLPEDQASIYLPRDRGVYPAHVLHHEIGHLLLWDREARSENKSVMLSCEDDPHVEHVAEAFAHYMSARLLRLRTPHIERLLG